MSVSRAQATGGRVSLLCKLRGSPRLRGVALGTAHQRKNRHSGQWWAMPTLQK